jgi:hypothetical protein
LALTLLKTRPAFDPPYSQQTQFPGAPALQMIWWPPTQVPGTHAPTLPVTDAHALVACVLSIVPRATQS